MGESKNGGPAFPSLPTYDGAGYPEQSADGMTLRDWFAGQALSGLMANSGGPIQANDQSGWAYTNCGTDTVAREAYALADAMLAERSKP